MKELRPVQAALLRQMEKEGPVLIKITPNSLLWLQRLWNWGFIERHEPSRFRITDDGRRALDEHVEAS